MHAMSLKYRAVLAVVIGCVLGLGLPLSATLLNYSPSTSKQAELLRESELLAEVMARVKNDYVEPVSDEVLLRGAINGMIQALDAHSEFLDADEYAEIKVSSSGNYTGIGIEVSLAAGAIRVVAPFDDTPAQKAGILPGDIIVSIDGHEVDANQLSDAVSRLRGKSGSLVSLAVVRDGVDTPINYTLKRRAVRVVSVRGELLKPDVAYVRISQFNDSTANDLKKKLRLLKRENRADLSALIMDLRNNPGGVLEAAVQVSDLFLTDGIIVRATGRNARDEFVHSARRGDVLNGVPIMILINEGSASASEIVAGALRDNDRATLIGTTSYGKGSVQTVMPVRGGNAIKLTTSKYVTPSGLSIHDSGIDPDFLIPMDEALTAAVQMTAKPTPASDPQLAEALGLLDKPYLLHSKAP